MERYSSSTCSPPVLLPDYFHTTKPSLHHFEHAALVEPKAGG